VRIAAVIACTLVLGCGAEGNRPGLAFLPDMAESVPYDPYDRNDHTGGGTLLLPPEGTIPMGFTPFPYGPEKEEAARAGRELVNPLSAEPEELRRGASEFANKCQVCHGPGGEGDGPIIGRFPNPPSLLGERARALPDGHLYHIMTRGQGIMPSHAVQVLPDDRWRLVLHVRTLQAAAPAPPPTAEPDAENATEQTGETATEPPEESAAEQLEETGA